MGLGKLFKDYHDDKNRIFTFNDPMTTKISWERMRKRSGSSFKTHYAEVVDQSVLQFKKTVMSKLMPFLPLGIGLIMLYIFNDFEFDFRLLEITGSDSYFQIGIVIFLIVLGIVMLIYGQRQIVLDKQLGYCYKGWVTPSDKTEPKEGKNMTHLSNVYAVQIISKIVKTKNSRYRSYELNLVLKNGNRVYLIDHANQKSIRNDAIIVSRFLNDIPIWDITLDK